MVSPQYGLASGRSCNWSEQDRVSSKSALTIRVCLVWPRVAKALLVWPMPICGMINLGKYPSQIPLSWVRDLNLDTLYFKDLIDSLFY